MNESSPPLKMRDVLWACCESFGVTSEELKGKSRRADITVCRQATAALIRYLVPRASMPMIGDLLNRDHTTILHSCRKMQQAIETVASKLNGVVAPLEWANALKREFDFTVPKRSESTKRMKRRWTEEAVATLKGMWETHSPAEIGGVIGVSTPGIRSKAAQLGLKSNLFRRVKERQALRAAAKKEQYERKLASKRMVPNGGGMSIQAVMKSSHSRAPSHVLAEALAAYGKPQDITAIIFGDPPYGRSALERTRQHDAG